MTRILKNITACAMALLLPITSYAGVIRDAEIEATLRAYAQPIFRAAEVDPDTVRIFLMSSPEINAYVAGGLNLFINTGLILETKNASMVLGVMAHETGHIAGAHLSQTREKSTRAMIGGLIGAAVGAAAAVGGAGQAGAGIIAGSQSMATRGFLSEIRVIEASADQAALTYLDANDMSASGMLETFELLRQREAGGTKPDPFLLNHPLSSERITTMRNHINASDIPAGAVPSGFDAMHARMVAKLFAFTKPYDETLNKYPVSDHSVPARYARAIAEFRRSHLDAALTEINSLIKQAPNDAYFYDTKGQILFESGKLPEAATTYASAHRLKPDNALILTDYARALIAQEKPELLNQAVSLLERARDRDDTYSMTWRQLAVAYGRQGKLGKSYQALAEEASLDGDYKGALQHLARARSYAKDEPNLGLALDDLESDVKAQLERKKEEESPF